MILLIEEDKGNGNLIMKIVGVQNYEGEFKDADDSFLILVERLEGFDLLRVTQARIDNEAHWNMTNLPSKPEVFPEVLGKFMPEVVALLNPVIVADSAGYKEINDALSEYFRVYGEVF